MGIPVLNNSKTHMQSSNTVENNHIEKAKFNECKNCFKDARSNIQNQMNSKMFTF